MSKDCGHKVPCGCKDNGLHTPPPCNTSGDCAGERCSELFNQECITYSGEPMELDLGTALFTVNPGDRLDVIIQKLILSFVSGVQQSVAPLTRVIDKTASTLTIEYIVQTAGDYTFNAEQQNPLTTNSVVLTGLTPGTYTHTFINLFSGADYVLYTTNVTAGLDGMQILVTLP